MFQGFQNIILAIKDWANGKFQPSGNYALVDNAGYSLGLNIDSDYIMTIELKNASGNVLSAQSIDFPIESMVVNASYADGELTLTLQNAQELTVDISAIVNGLVNDTFTIVGINMKDDITKEELASALGVPTKVSDLENDSNFLTKTGDASNTTVTFEQASQRANVQPGDDLATAFAKLSKYCADLKSIAFTGYYGDLTGVPSSLKNPNPLTFTGNATGSYDGSMPVTIDIPTPVFPVIGNGTVTVLKNETPVASFGLNDSFDSVFNIDVPTLTNNLLATEPGTALDAVQGKALDERLNAATKCIGINNPNSKDDVLNFIVNNIDLFNKSNIVPFYIITTNGRLGNDISNGNYFGVLTLQGNAITGILTNYWNACTRLSISVILHEEPKTIYIKFENFEYFYNQIDQINSDLQGFKYITVYKNTPDGIVNNLEQFKCKTPFLFICYNLTDRTLYPHIPVTYSSGIYNVLGDGIYRTILLFDTANLNSSPNNIYFARLKGDDEVKWYTVPTSEL